MIVKVCEPGRDLGGLASYLLGRGKANIHVDQRIVASSGAQECSVGELKVWHPGELAVVHQERVGLWSHAEAHEVAGVVEAHARRLPTWNSGEAQAERVAAGNGGDLMVKSDRKSTKQDASHVVHVVFALPKEEGHLSDEVWGRVAQRWVDGMGLSDCRWIGVRHGDSENGNDHLHIAMCGVDSQGRNLASKIRFRKSRQIADQIEKDFGLVSVKQRLGQTSKLDVHAAELRTSGIKNLDQEEAKFDILRAKVVSAAALAKDERDFILRCHEADVTVSPRWEKSTGEVSGFAVCLGDDQSTWTAAGGLDESLSLPMLRRTWPESKPADAIELWEQVSQVEVPESLSVQLRELAHASRSEEEFVRRCKLDGLDLRPRFDSRVGVQGFAVRRLGEKGVWRSAAKLGDDLGLPALRETHGWGRKEQGAAVEEWVVCAAQFDPERWQQRVDRSWSFAEKRLDKWATKVQQASMKLELAERISASRDLNAMWSTIAEHSDIPAVKEACRLRARAAARAASWEDVATRSEGAADVCRTVHVGLRALSESRTTRILAMLRQLDRTQQALAEASEAARDLREARALREVGTVKLRQARDVLHDEKKRERDLRGKTHRTFAAYSIKTDHHSHKHTQHIQGEDHGRG